MTTTDKGLEDMPFYKVYSDTRSLEDLYEVNSTYPPPKCTADFSASFTTSTREKGEIRKDFLPESHINERCGTEL
jgi:hypothetical protein